MSKIRLYEMAKKLNVTSKELINYLKDFNVEVPSHMSTLDDEVVDLLNEAFSDEDEIVEEDFEEIEKAKTKKKPAKKKTRRRLLL